MISRRLRRTTAPVVNPQRKPTTKDRRARRFLRRAILDATEPHSAAMTATATSSEMNSGTSEPI
jgi:hypothetical protein